MKKTLFIALIGISSILSAEAFAKLGSSGCGLGSQLFKNDNKQVTQVLSATTNGTFGNQTFGITSGTSNCTDHGTVAEHKEVPMFIETNQVALANDIARGNGETLAHLSEVMGCSDSETLGSALKQNYRSIFTIENIKQAKVTQSILDTVKGNEKLASGCKHVI